MGEYIPQRGDLVWLTFNPQAGHEQSGRRPALVLSPGVYQAKTGLFLACPITSQVKGYPFEVALPEGLPVKGVILSDQIHNLDWRAREADFIARLDVRTVEKVLERIKTIL